jgi:hypothetical protein
VVLVYLVDSCAALPMARKLSLYYEGLTHDLYIVIIKDSL